MNTIKCIIIDDEALARQLIAARAEKIPFLEVAESCSSAIEAYQLLSSESIDLIFLDV